MLDAASTDPRFTISLKRMPKGNREPPGGVWFFPVSCPVWSVAAPPQLVLHGPAAAFLPRPSVLTASPLSALAIVSPHCLPDSVRIDLSDFCRRRAMVLLPRLVDPNTPKQLFTLLWSQKDGLIGARLSLKPFYRRSCIWSKFAIRRVVEKSKCDEWPLNFDVLFGCQEGLGYCIFAKLAPVASGAAVITLEVNLRELLSHEQ
jgi:hypothetical protein